MKYLERRGNNMASLSERLAETWQFSNEKIGNLNAAQKMFVVFDSAWERFIHGANKVDYFQYGFYFKRRPAREQFVTIGKLRSFYRTCNDQEKSKIFSDKAAFAKTFKEYIGRDILDMKNASYEDFNAFVKKHDKMFIKPQDGTYGRGVRIVECDKNRGTDLYERLNGKNVLVEEVINQHPELAAFNASTLNSLRVVTLLRPNGEVSVLPGSAIRVGRSGKIADNFHHNGLGAQIDNETGIVCSTGIDKSGNRHIIHPDSKLTLLGFRIPFWDEVKKCVCSAAKVVPEVRYVGWDVAITDDNRIVLIEGNDRADPDLGQMSDGIGKWPVFKKYMDEIKALHKYERSLV